MRRPSLTNKDGEVRPLTAKDLKHFRSIAEADPGMIEAVEQFKRRAGRPVIGDAPKMVAPIGEWTCEPPHTQARIWFAETAFEVLARANALAGPPSIAFPVTGRHFV
jgi:hypothetical protein